MLFIRENQCNPVGNILRGNGFLPVVFHPGMNMAEIAYLYRDDGDRTTGIGRRIIMLLIF